MNLLSASHDLHLLRIDSREDTLVRHSSDWITAVIEDINERILVRRNRERISEINHLIDYEMEESNEMGDQVVIGALSEEALLDIEQEHEDIDEILSDEKAAAKGLSVVEGATKGSLAAEPSEHEGSVASQQSAGPPAEVASQHSQAPQDD